MIKKKFHRKSQIAINKLIIWLIVAFVIILVFTLIFKFDIVKWVKMIPVFTPLFPDDDINVRQNTLPDGCSNMVAKVDGDYIYFGEEKTNLRVVSENGELNILLDLTFPTRNELFGIIDKTSNKITILDYFINEQSSQFQQYKNELPLLENIKSLNGGYYGSGRICNVYSGDLEELMKYYKINPLNSPKSKEPLYCKCGDKCKDYANWITTYSTENGMEPLLVLALIFQESQCNANAESSSASYGLMQINEDTFDDTCKGSVSSKFNKILGEVNAEKNLRCGIKIFESKHNSFISGVKSSNTYNSNEAFKKLVDSCIKKYSKYSEYTGWDAALRAYNGWGCTPPGADIDYVEKVNAIKGILLKGVPT